MSRVRILPPAARYFKKLRDRRLKELYRDAIEEISGNPHAGRPKTGDLAGIYGYDIYYDRTNYELAYRVEVHEDTIVIIIMAGTRENFYEQLKRYMKQ